MSDLHVLRCLDCAFFLAYQFLKCIFCVILIMLFIIFSTSLLFTRRTFFASAFSVSRRMLADALHFRTPSSA
jgi:hypothetical protein